MGELVYDVLAAKEKSKGASGKEWHATKAHLERNKNVKKSANVERLTNMYSLTLTTKTRAAASR